MSFKSLLNNHLEISHISHSSCGTRYKFKAKFSTKFCFCCLSYLKELGFDNKNITSIQDIEIAKSKNLAEVRFDPFRTHN